MVYPTRDDVMEGKATAENYDRWHEALDDVTTVTDFHPAEARTLDEILGDEEAQTGN